MTQVNDLTKAVAQFEQDVSLVAVIELSQSSWLVGALVPGVERAPLKKFDPNEGALLRLLHR